MSKWFKQNRELMAAGVFLLPNFAGFLLFTAFPVGLSLYMSFTNWSLKKTVPLEFVGFSNYADLLADGKFWFYFYNTVYFMFGIPFAVFGSLVAANLLVNDLLIKKVSNRLKTACVVALTGIITCVWLFLAGSPDWALLLALLYLAAFFGILFGSNTYRTMMYIPNFASGVATIILWVQVFNPHFGLANGVLDAVFGWFGLHPELPTWLTSTKNLLGFLPLPNLFSNGGFGLGAREAIMIMGFWMAIGGNNMILYIASIANIPQALYEAAEIDGAGAVAKFRHITIPSVAATTFFISVMAVIGGIQGGFDTAKIMTQGGPAGTTTTLSYYIFTAGFEELRLGYASAVSWIMFVIIFVLTLLNWKYGNRQNEYQ